MNIIIMPMLTSSGALNAPLSDTAAVALLCLCALTIVAVVFVLIYMSK